MIDCNCMLLRNPLTERSEWRVAPLAGCSHVEGEPATSKSGPVIGQVWLTECQRCANSEYSVEADPNAARAELAEAGWTDCCPACNGVPR